MQRSFLSLTLNLFKGALPSWHQTATVCCMSSSLKCVQSLCNGSGYCWKTHAQHEAHSELEAITNATNCPDIFHLMPQWVPLDCRLNLQCGWTRLGGNAKFCFLTQLFNSSCNTDLYLIPDTHLTDGYVAMELAISICALVLPCTTGQVADESPFLKHSLASNAPL